MLTFHYLIQQYASKARYVCSVAALCEMYLIVLSLQYVKSAAQFCWINSAFLTMGNHSKWCFFNYNTCPSPCFLYTLTSFPCIGGEVYAHSTLQKGSGGRATHFQGHDSGYTESPVKLMRLTKGASISLPSSPLLPRQANIVPSQSCIKFTGGCN